MLTTGKVFLSIFHIDTDLMGAVLVSLIRVRVSWGSGALDEVVWPLPLTASSFV